MRQRQILEELIQPSIQTVAMEARPYLDSLPPEVYHMIIGDLRIGEVSKLSRTSKGHRSLLEPTLYQEIRSQQEDAKFPFPAHLLLRSIQSRPQLANYVNCLTLDCWRPHKRKRISRKRIASYFTDTEMDCVYSLIRSLQVHDESSWISRLRRGDRNLFVALLVSQLTNLRRLYLGIGYQHTVPKFLGVLLDKAIPGNFLHALEDIEISTDINNNDDVKFVIGSYHDFNAQSWPLFSLPSMKRISISPPPGLKYFIQDLLATGLTTLDLHHSQILETELGKVLEKTPSLKHLIYDAWVNYKTRKPPPNRASLEVFCCDDLSRSLAHVRNSLERLEIRLCFFANDTCYFGNTWQGLNCDMFSRGSNYAIKRRGCYGKLDILRDFPRLSSLAMPAALLSDWTTERELFEEIGTLPPRLRELLPMQSLVNLYLSDRCDMYGFLAQDDFVEDHDSEWSDFDNFDETPFWLDEDYCPAPIDIIRRLR